MIFVLFSLYLSNNFTNGGRRHFKLFKTCNVSWDTLYVSFPTFEQNDDPI